MFVYDATLRVRYAETDQMGVVYHTNYIVWFEVGRTEWFRQLKHNYRELEDIDIILPVIDVKCEYKKPALYDNEIIIRTYLKSLKGVRLTFHYEVLRKDSEELLAVGETSHAFVTKDMKPIKLKKDFPEVWKELNKNVNPSE